METKKRRCRAVKPGVGLFIILLLGCENQVKTRYLSILFEPGPAQPLHLIGDG
jgi:hypothetical protein